MKTYSAPVTTMEIFDISEAELNKERNFQLGKQHRKEGKPCASANGAYLDGWYNPEKDYYFIPKAAARLL